jgi:hypothetical protein
MAMVTNQVAGGPFGDARIARLGTAVFRCAADARLSRAVPEPISLPAPIARAQ